MTENTIWDKIENKEMANGILPAVASTSVTTPRGSSVPVLIRGEELNPVQILQINNSVSSAYPNTSYISTSTTKYNYHSYAWYSASFSNQYWMNDASAYVSDGSYTNFTNILNASSGTKVYYDYGLRSAIVNSAGDSFNFLVSKFIIGGSSLRTLQGLILIIFIIMIFPGCETKKNETLNIISVKAENDQMNPTVKSKTINSMDNIDSELFQNIITENDSSIPYSKLGEVIQIELGDKTPISYALTDYILKDDGTFKYNLPPKPEQPTDVTFEKGIIIFELRPNFTAAYSSDIKDYEAGATLLGFRLVCDWGDLYEKRIWICYSNRCL